MKKSFLLIALVCVMVFAFAATAMADHSPDFYIDFQAGNGVMNNTSFQAVFPTTWLTAVTTEIDNGSWGNGTAVPHYGYSQSTAKCSVCHAVHRAPTLGTGTYASADHLGTLGLNGTQTTGVSSSRYSYSAWTADASTQMLLRTTTANACIYCHVTEAPSGKMYGGDTSLAIVGDTATGWGQFYAHTTGCIGCHAVHGANTFQGVGVAGKILKYQGVKNLGTIQLAVQPEVYGTTFTAGNVAQVENGALYTSKANMIAGTLSATASGAGVAPLDAAITAQCTICHASYAVGEETVNLNYRNAELFQPGTWASANGSVAKIYVGQPTDIVSVLPGTAGLSYTTDPNAPGSVILAYKNHPMNHGTSAFKGAGASAFFTATSTLISTADASTCQSCHNAPRGTAVGSQDGAYTIQSYPHYTPGYYKFMGALNQAAFDTPTTLAQFMGGRQAFYSNGGHPAIMNDGYCTKCHGQVGTMY